MEISNLLKRKYIGFKQLGNNAIALTKFIYISEVLPRIEEYTITDKADGERAFIISRKENKPKAILADKIFDIDINLHGIFDCEKINNTYHIFDVLEYDGKNVSILPFSERLKILRQITLSADNIAIKKYYDLTKGNYAQEIKKCLSSPRKYDIDGLIFTSLNDNYISTSNYKWKPPEKLTIDFLYMNDILWVGIDMMSWLKYGPKLPKNYSELTEPMHITSNNIIYKKYFPVPFICSFGDFSTSKSLKKKLSSADLKVVELSWEDDDWVFHRIREDRTKELSTGKYFGNNYKIAEQTLQATLNPLTLDMLIDSYEKIAKDFYFQKSDDTYKGVRKFVNFIKNALIQQYKTNKVIDLASGKGQDIMKYADAHVRELLLIEIDNNAIDEILTRKYSLRSHIGKKEFINISELPDMITHIRNLDLNTDSKKLLLKIPKISGNVFCNLAFHYLTESIKSIKNICFLINNLLPHEGEFIFTALDKNKVEDLIRDKSWKTDKYLLEINKKQSTKDFCRINVKLPCSDEIREETLINLQIIDSCFLPYKIIRVAHVSFKKSLDEFKRHKPFFYQELDSDDLQFVELYSYTIYKKF